MASIWRSVSRGFLEPPHLPQGVPEVVQRRALINQSDASKELARLVRLVRLVRLGMLTEERSETERRVYYARTESLLWQIITTAAEVINIADQP
ncbi:MAG: hypothetical protein JWO59_3020 [Chloroflexi bacterium]|nr:hypothetical protein [Chloroflexota bacterium]